MRATTLHMAAPIGLPTVDLNLLPNKEAVAAFVNHFKAVGLFALAPFIGLAYAVLLPFVGLAMLAWIGGKALVRAPATRTALIFAKNVALLVAAPFIGLVYAAMFPFVGIAMLLWMGAKALIRVPAR